MNIIGIITTIISKRNSKNMSFINGSTGRCVSISGSSNIIIHSNSNNNGNGNKDNDHNNKATKIAFAGPQTSSSAVVALSAVIMSTDELTDPINNFCQCYCHHYDSIYYYCHCSSDNYKRLLPMLWLLLLPRPLPQRLSLLLPLHLLPLPRLLLLLWLLLLLRQLPLLVLQRFPPATCSEQRTVRAWETSLALSSIGQFCAVINCANSRKKTAVMSFFCLPKEEEKR